MVERRTLSRIPKIPLWELVVPTGADLTLVGRLQWSLDQTSTRVCRFSQRRPAEGTSSRDWGLPASRRCLELPVQNPFATVLAGQPPIPDCATPPS